MNYGQSGAYGKKMELLEIADLLAACAEDPPKVREIAGRLRSILQGSDEKLHVETELGTLYAYPSGDTDYPGIYIDLKRPGQAVDAPLILLEFTKTEWDDCGEMHPPSLICRCWDDVLQDEYGTKVIYRNVESFFEKLLVGDMRNAE